MSAGIQQGTILTKRDGTQIKGPAMSFRAPFWVFDGGVAVANYGDDDVAAFWHYDHLLRAHRERLGYTIHDARIVH